MSPALTDRDRSRRLGCTSERANGVVLEADAHAPESSRCKGRAPKTRWLRRYPTWRVIMPAVTSGNAGSPAPPNAVRRCSVPVVSIVAPRTSPQAVARASCRSSTRRRSGRIRVPGTRHRRCRTLGAQAAARSRREQSRLGGPRTSRADSQFWRLDVRRSSSPMAARRPMRRGSRRDMPVVPDLRLSGARRASEPDAHCAAASFDRISPVLTVLQMRTSVSTTFRVSQSRSATSSSMPSVTATGSPRLEPGRAPRRRAARAAAGQQGRPS